MLEWLTPRRKATLYTDRLCTLARVLCLMASYTLSTVVNAQTQNLTTLTLHKTVINQQGGQLSEADFALTIDAVTVQSGIAQVVEPNVDLLVAVSDRDGYREGDWYCIDQENLSSNLPESGDPSGTQLNLRAGSTVECFVVINDQPVDLRLLKLADVNTSSPGSVVTYEVIVENTGSAIAHRIQVTDKLPAELSYLPDSIVGGDSSDDSDPAGKGLSWNIGSLNPGSVMVLSFQVTVGAQ